jgi:cyclophilin family peptidyl-prolyl cis-trans isomerase
LESNVRSNCDRHAGDGGAGPSRADFSSLSGMRTAFSRVAVGLGALTMMASCGGGGGTSSSGNQAPVAAARAAGEAVLNAQTAFDTTGTKDPEGKPLLRSWNYGDGSTGSSDVHTYASTGTFVAVFTVKDDQGASASASVPVTVAKCSVSGTQAATLSPYPTVCVQTSLGEMVLEVYPARAPQSAANFLKYVGDGFYGGTIFHRVIRGFVAQGGGFTSGMTGKAATYPPISLESNNGLQNWQYTLAMARTSVPDSATSQFFINLVDNHALDYSASQSTPNGYAVFGQVISGTNVADAIGNVSTGAVAGFADVPLADVLLVSAVRMP